jgi:Uma2 family endonuclease
MSALRQPKEIVTAEHYLRVERLAETKSEYVNGRIYPRAGSNITHACITENILTSLGTQLRGRPCEVFGSDVKVRIDKANCFRYPDLSGLCGPIIHHDAEKDAYCNPSLIVEVLSPATAMLDRGEKFNLYRLIDTFVEYLLVRQDRMEVELFTRESTQEWSSVLYNEATDVVPLRSLNCTLTLAEIYDKVNFEE